MSRFVLGNCIDVMARIPDNGIDFILTDPPYLVGFRDRQGRTIAGDKTDEWLQPACNEMYRVCADGQLLRLEPRRSLYGRLEKCGIQCGWAPGLHQKLHIEGRICGLSPRMRLRSGKRPSGAASEAITRRAGLEIFRQSSSPDGKACYQPATTD